MKDTLSVLALMALLGAGATVRASAPECQGHFVNPITDICWQCLFPLTIGNVPVAAGNEPDTENPSSPVQICPVSELYRIGIAIGYWEPFALTDVTRAPYCMLNLGGFSISAGKLGSGGGKRQGGDDTAAFYHVHWYKYPLTWWLNIITDLGCMQGGDMDIGYLSELDPTWNDSSLASVLSPRRFCSRTPSLRAPVLRMPWPARYPCPSTLCSGVPVHTGVFILSRGLFLTRPVRRQPVCCCQNAWHTNCTGRA